jgi:hypothetical protein
MRRQRQLRRRTWQLPKRPGRSRGTEDKDLTWFTEQSPANALRLETYIQDAQRDGDSELADLFRRAQSESRKGGELGKEFLRKRLGGK